jgi:hypothetical protein
MSKGFTCAAAATSSNPMTVMSMVMSTSGRAWIRKIVSGVSSGTPADLESVLYIDRITASGTATTIASTGLGVDDLADIGTEEAKLHKEHSVEPTYSSRPFYNEPVNHRVKEVIELADNRAWILPATAGAGMGIRWTSTGVPVARTVVSWRE